VLINIHKYSFTKKNEKFRRLTKGKKFWEKPNEDPSLWMVKRKVFNPVISKGQSCSKYNAPAKKDLLPTRFINIKTFEIIQRYLFMYRQDSLYVDIN